MRYHEQETDQEPTQQFDEMLCEGVYYIEPFTIRMRGSIEREEGVRERREIVKLISTAQPRDYVFIEPYILVPDIQICIDLFPTPSPTGAIGTVASTDWTGMQQQRIGDGQAWYYHRDRTIILWELTVFHHYQEKQPLAPDGNVSRMWRGFERFLVDRFPKARRIATLERGSHVLSQPSKRGNRSSNDGLFSSIVMNTALGHDLDYDTTAYQQFLRGLEYSERSPEIFTKIVKR